MRTLSAALFVIAGLINAFPLIGLLSAARLEALYAIPIGEPNLEILMRHRAVLLGLLGAALIGAAFRPAWRLPAASAGFVSMVAFVALAWSVGGANAALDRVVVADLVAIVVLAIAIGLERRAQ